MGRGHTLKTALPFRPFQPALCLSIHYAATLHIFSFQALPLPFKRDNLCTVSYYPHFSDLCNTDNTCIIHCYAIYVCSLDQMLRDSGMMEDREYQTYRSLFSNMSNFM